MASAVLNKLVMNTSCSWHGFDLEVGIEVVLLRISWISNLSLMHLGASLSDLTGQILTVCDLLSFAPPLLFIICCD